MLTAISDAGSTPAAFTTFLTPESAVVHPVWTQKCQRDGAPLRAVGRHVSEPVGGQRQERMGSDGAILPRLCDGTSHRKLL